MSDDPRIAIIARVISQEGGDPGNSIHGWRCDYPERFGKCGCVEETARMIVAALDGMVERPVLTMVVYDCHLCNERFQDDIYTRGISDLENHLAREHNYHVKLRTAE